LYVYNKNKLISHNIRRLSSLEYMKSKFTSIEQALGIRNRISYHTKRVYSNT